MLDIGMGDWITQKDIVFYVKVRSFGLYKR